MTTQHPTKPAPKKLTLKRETLRRLTPADLRLAGGGLRNQRCISSNSTGC